MGPVIQRVSMAAGPLVFPHLETLDMVALARKMVSVEDNTIAVVQYTGNDNDTITLYSYVSDVATQIKERWSTGEFEQFECYDDALSLRAYTYTWHIFGLWKVKYPKLKELLHF